MNSKISSNIKAILGKDGWLFLSNDTNKCLDQFQGKLILTDEQLYLWSNILRNRCIAFKKLNIPVVNLFVKNKESILFEYLPHGIIRSDNTVYDQFNKIINSDYDILESWLDPDVSSHPDKDNFFCKVDTHWTAWGSLFYYNEFLSFLHKKEINIESARKDHFSVKSATISGDLGDKFDPPINSNQFYIDSSFFGVENYSNGVKNIGLFRYFFNPDAANQKKIIVSGNSFAGGDFLNLIRLTFRDVYFIFSPNFDIKLAYIIKPDIVIIQYLERFLPWVPSDEFGLNVFDMASMKIISGESDLNRMIDKLPFKSNFIPASSYLNYYNYLINRSILKFSKLENSEKKQFLYWLFNNKDFGLDLINYIKKDFFYRKFISEEWFFLLEKSLNQ